MKQLSIPQIEAALGPSLFNRNLVYRESLDSTTWHHGARPKALSCFATSRPLGGADWEGGGNHPKIQTSSCPW